MRTIHDIQFPIEPHILGQIAEANGIEAGQPFPRTVDRSLGDGDTTCLFHRGWEWSIKFYEPLLPSCTICGGKVDPRLSAHCLCVERQKRNLPIIQLNHIPVCGCSRCAAKK